ncbi:MAG: group I truncated hemoglobin [Wenzhouxiangella sp.]
MMIVRITLVASLFFLAACGSVPSHDSDGVSDLKNYDRTLYERLSTERRSLYDRLGGRATIERFVDRGVERVVVNPEIADLFVHTDRDHLKFHLTEQICELAGGPCRYEGLDMESAHVGQNISSREFNALVEDFQLAMRETGVPYRLENQVIALLAPMKPAMLHR